MSLHLRRIGGISEEEHAADVDGKVAEILKNNDCVGVGGGLWNACCTTPSVCLQQEGQTSCGQLRICSSQPASQSTEAAGKGSGLWTDGTGDDRINLEGLTEPLAFMDLSLIHI